MKVLSLKELLPILKGEIIIGNDQILIRKVSRKAERVSRNTLYFHLRKKKIDYEKLVKKRSFVIVTDKLNDDFEQLHASATVVFVNDVHIAYRAFISYYRSLFSIPVIGVTGTCGKTTTKEMIKHILSHEMNVHATYKSQNAISLNLHYLMGIDQKTEASVIEMGVSHPGNIKKTGDYFLPNVGVITNIGVAHLEGCKTFENYLQAKAEMLQALQYNGTLILNGDDENIKKIDLHEFKGKVLYFGLSKGQDFIASDLSINETDTEFLLHVNNKCMKVNLQTIGEHNVYNALAAISACYAIGLDMDTILKNIQSFQTIEKHIQVYEGINGCKVIDDTWNCNSTSMKAALEVLSKIDDKNTKIAVLGKLQRLGNSEVEEHKKMGEAFIEIGGIDKLITVGEKADIIAKRACELGMEEHNIYFTKNATELNELLKELLTNDTTVLFKMSLDKMDASFRILIKQIRTELP